MEEASLVGGVARIFPGGALHKVARLGKVGTSLPDRIIFVHPPLWSKCR